MPRAKDSGSKPSVVEEPLVKNIARDMWETAYIVAFCEKFKTVLRNIQFGPGELENALQSGIQDELLEQIHCSFLANCLNRKKPLDPAAWQKILSNTIDSHLRGHVPDFYLDYNPLRGSNGDIDYYSLKAEDKILILYHLINWQLRESEVVRSLINDSYKRAKKNYDNPLEVEEIGQDSKNAKYYYIGDDARIYREKIPRAGTNLTHKTMKWEVVTSNVEDIQKFLNDLSSKKSAKDKALHAKILKEILPNAELMIKMKERKEATRQRQARLAEKYEQMRVDAISTRTRGAQKKAAGVEAPRISYREDDYYYGDDYDVYEEDHHLLSRETKRPGLRSAKSNSNSYANSEISDKDFVPENKTKRDQLSFHQAIDGHMTRSRSRRESRNAIQSSASSEFGNLSLMTDTTMQQPQNIDVKAQNHLDHDVTTDTLPASDIFMEDVSENVMNNTPKIDTIWAPIQTPEIMANETQDHSIVEKEISFMSCGSTMSLSTPAYHVHQPETQATSNYPS